MADNVIRYPANTEITPHGWYQLIKGNIPTMWLTSYDGSIEIFLLGGHAIPDRHKAPEWVAIPPDGLSGLIPPWQHIDQKGATQDGVDHQDTLYDPIEIGLKLVCHARDGKHLQRVVRHVIESLRGEAGDAMSSRIHWLTHDLGHWWADVHWFKGAPVDPLSGAYTRTQTLSLRLRAPDAFWRSYADIASFAFTYDDMVDEFDTEYPDGAGPDWPVWYYDVDDAGNPYPGAGHPWVVRGQLGWKEEGTLSNACVLGPVRDFSTATDYQVVTVTLGSIPEITFPGGAYNDIWVRMGRDGTGAWDGNGVRVRIGRNGIIGWIKVSRFKNFVQTLLYERPLVIPPFWGETWTVVAGAQDDPRLFQVMRGDGRIPILRHKETGTNLSELGAAYRGVGVGFMAGRGVFSQASPSWVRRFTAGDNAAITQSGWLKLTNIGDQPCYYDYTLFGPGTFRIWDGPESDDYVQMGPLVPNQVVLLRSDPRVNTTLVQDLTTTPATPQQRDRFARWRERFESFARGANVRKLDKVADSVFGVQTPQGNLYRFLDGRFSDRSAIPPRPAGRPATPYHVKCEIVDGTAESMILASGTPLRRYPV